MNRVLSTVLMILATLLLFGFLIFIHELGHFMTARLFKVTVNEFAIGMGPAIYKRVSKKSGILYSFRAFPIGGYVSMEGEDGDSADPNSFSKKHVSKRMVITAAGAAMNLLFGLILAFSYIVSMPNFAGTTVTKFHPEATSHTESMDSLQLGDEILKVDTVKVKTGQELVYHIFRRGDQPLDLTVKRNGEELILHNVKFPTTTDSGHQFGTLDFYVNPLKKTFGRVFQNTFRQMGLSVRMVYESLYDLITGRFGMEQISGPVGTAGVVGDAISSDIHAGEGQQRNSFLYVCMIITVNLGIFNLLPIPALDGGRLFFQLIELIFRKPVPLKYEAMIHAVGIVLLLLLTVVITFKDLFKLFT